MWDEDEKGVEESLTGNIVDPPVDEDDENQFMTAEDKEDESSEPKQDMINDLFGPDDKNSKDKDDNDKIDWLKNCKISFK